MTDISKELDYIISELDNEANAQGLPREMQDWALTELVALFNRLLTNIQAEAPTDLNLNGSYEKYPSGWNEALAAYNKVIEKWKGKG